MFGPDVIGSPCLIGCFTIFASLASSLVGQPQTKPTEGFELEPFPVLGTRLPADQLPDSPALVVIERAEIERYGASGLTGVLPRLPQVYNGVGSGIATVPNGAPSPRQDSAGAST